MSKILYVTEIRIVRAFQGMPVPAADSLNLFSLTFDDFSLNDDEMLMAAVSMFLELGLVKTFNIEKEVSNTDFWVNFRAAFLHLHITTCCSGGKRVRVSAATFCLPNDRITNSYLTESNLRLNALKETIFSLN